MSNEKALITVLMSDVNRLAKLTESLAKDVARLSAEIEELKNR